ncbi:MAG: Gfo/Idh/MocA family oxidoreductase, partial [Candidatus Nanoarchaeia archaeon]
MKTILIGLGDIASKHIEVMRKLDCEIIGVLGRDYEKTNTNANKLGIKNVYKSFDDLSKDDCDFFTILTSP